MPSETRAYEYGTLISQQHDTLNIEPIQDFIHRITAIIFLIVPPIRTPWFNKSEITP